MLSVCAPEAFILYVIRMVGSAAGSGKLGLNVLSACSFCSGWKLTHTWQARAVTWILLLPVDSWENLLGLLFLEILCH